MNIPDYVSPIVAHRVWQSDGCGLVSLSGERWPSGHALTAKCRMAPHRHQAPQKNRTCGVYAARTLDRLREMGYAACAICGEVYLWGIVEEHEFGWRAQFAYPKNLVVPFEMIPADVQEAQSYVQALVAYGVDVFIDDGEKRIPVWIKGTGYDSAGLDYVRKVAGGEIEVAVPIAVLKEDPRRQILLQNGRRVRHSAEIVFTPFRFSVSAPEAITHQIKDAQAVVFDLKPGNARVTSHAINVVRRASYDTDKARSKVAIFVRLNWRNPAIMRPGVSLLADGYLNHDGRYDVQFAFKRFLRKERKPQWAPRSAPPGSGTPPGGLPPPPPVPVHSSWDIPRILQCTRYRWPERWTPTMVVFESGPGQNTAGALFA